MKRFGEMAGIMCFGLVLFLTLYLFFIIKVIATERSVNNMHYLPFSFFFPALKAVNSSADISRSEKSSLLIRR